MNKNRQYWLDRGKDGEKYEGYVCLGVGDREFSLNEQLSLSDSNFYSKEAFGSPKSLISTWYGSDEDRFYYLTDNIFNELFPEDPNSILKEETAQFIENQFETTEQEVINLPITLFQNILSALQIGFENTEEVFILNGQRTTRSDRMNAVRLENEMLAISNVLTELKSRL